MSQRREPLSQPALLPLYGNVDKKPRFLDRDVVTIGRARGCDLVLDAADVSTIHCILYRTPDGLKLRDCGSRTGTRVNGESVRAAGVAITDTDIIQLGTFSFQVSLPAELFPRDGKRVDPVRFQRLQRSRKHLAQLALNLRRRLVLGGSNPSIDLDLARKLQGLRDKIKQYDQRIGQLEEAEHELEQERAGLRREQEQHREHVAAVEGELAKRLDEADRQIRARWAEFQTRCQEESHHLRDLITAPSQANGDGREHEASSRRQQELDERQAQLDEQAGQLKAQRLELARMMKDLKKLQEDLRGQKQGDGLADENARLKQILAQLQEANAAREEAQEALRAENAQLRKLLEEKSQPGPAPASAPAPAPAPAPAAAARPSEVEEELERLYAALGKVREENQALHELLEARGNEPARAGGPADAPSPPRSADELEMYELELNQFRRDLEAEKAKIEIEREQMRERTEEMDKEIRELEMQMSRERAEMGRERQRLERMREDLRADMEKAQREVVVRDTLAPVQKLRDEIAKKQPNDRFRSGRNLSDRPAN